MCKSKQEGGQRCNLDHGAKNRDQLRREYNRAYLRGANILREREGLSSLTSIVEAEQWVETLEENPNWLTQNPQTPVEEVNVLLEQEARLFLDDNKFHSLVTAEEKELLANLVDYSLASGHPLTYSPLSPSPLSAEQFKEMREDLESSLLEIDGEFFEHQEEVERGKRLWEGYTMPPEYVTQIQDREDLMKSLEEEAVYIENRLKKLNQDGNVLYGKNGCVKLRAEDGSIGYFKDTHSSSKNNLLLVGISEVGLLRHEVAAYALTQIMGEGYKNTVPPTYIRVYRDTDGTLRMGSIQEHRDGDLGFDVEEIRPNSLPLANNVKEAAIIGFLLGDQDRHGGNFIHNQESNEIYLIDNGYSFPETNLTPHEDSLQNPFKGQNVFLTERDIEKLSGLVASPGCRGLDKYLTKKEILELKKRIKIMLQRGQVPSPAEYYKTVEFEEWEQEAYKYRSKRSKPSKAT